MFTSVHAVRTRGCDWRSQEEGTDSGSCTFTMQQNEQKPEKRGRAHPLHNYRSSKLQWRWRGLHPSKAAAPTFHVLCFFRLPGFSPSLVFRNFRGACYSRLLLKKNNTCRMFLSRFDSIPPLFHSNFPLSSEPKCPVSIFHSFEDRFLIFFLFRPRIVDVFWI